VVGAGSESCLMVRFRISDVENSRSATRGFVTWLQLIVVQLKHVLKIILLKRLSDRIFSHVLRVLSIVVAITCPVINYTSFIYI
jgi:hypothetical protein